MSKRSSILKPLTTEGRHSSPLFRTNEESSIQKHAKFWDKTNKGYISPLDTISGFMTLGYSVLFSIALGVFVGVFLSLSTQTGWLPDPLCRSNVRNLIRSKKQTQSNCGAFDDDGVFNPDKFEALFSKYAKSDKTGKTITMPELIRMTQEQEKMGRNVKAWATGVVELCAAYFFIGHRGSLTKEDVRSAYDGSLFYRLKDNHKLMIQDKKQELSLKGAYLSKPPSPLSIKALEHRMQVLFSALQSKSSIAAEYGIHDWVSYLQERTNSIKDHAIPRALRRPNSFVSGVTTPKASTYRSAKAHDDPSKLFPDGLTGVAKATSEAAIMGTEFLSSLLRHGTAADPSNSKSRGIHGIFDHDIDNSTTGQHNSTILGNAAVVIENPAITEENAADFPPLPKSSASSTALKDDSLNAYLKSDDSHSHEWLAAGLTGVRQQEAKEHENIKKTTDISNKNTNIPVKKHSEPKQKTQDDHHHHSHEQIPKASITPPPEEKMPTPPTTTAIDNNNNNKNVTATPTNKKVKSKKNKLGQVSPISTSSSDSSNTCQEKTNDVSWATAE